MLDELADDHAVHVGGDDLKDEHHVGLEVLVGEVVERSLLLAVLDAAEDAHVLLDIGASLGRNAVVGHKRDEVDERERAEYDKPEPEDDVDLLREQVDGEHTLHRVEVIAAELAYLEVAVSDLGKVVVADHVEAVGHALENLEAEQVVVLDAEQLGHEEELAEHVGQVDELAEYVEYDEVVAEALAGPEEHEAERALALVAESGALARHVALLGLDELVDVTGEEVEQLLALRVLLHRLVLHGRVHVVDDLDAALVVERTPEHARHQEQHTLQQYDQMHPIYMSLEFRI